MPRNNQINMFINSPMFCMYVIKAIIMRRTWKCMFNMWFHDIIKFPHTNFQGHVDELRACK
eukprot:354046-Amphidinium_carterae.1